MGEVIKLRVASSEEAITLQSAAGPLAVEAVSPRVSFTKVDGGTRLDITDVDGTKTVILPDGATGQDGVGIKRVRVNANGELVIELTNDTIIFTDSVRGNDGRDGADGQDGVTFTPSVSSAGVISWTNDGGRLNPPPVIIKGPQGDMGPQGAPGPRGDKGDPGPTYTFDDAPTANSANPVKSGGIKSAIDWLDTDLRYFINHNSSAIDNLESSTTLAIAQINSTLNYKQDSLTFDETPMLASHNPVESRGIKEALNSVANRIPDVTGKADKVSNATAGNFAALDANGNMTDSGSKASDFLTEHQSLAGYVQNTDYAAANAAGVVKVDSNNGIGISGVTQKLYINSAADATIKSGTNNYAPIVPGNQHKSVFYGLAKAAGDTTQASSSNAVGTYTETARSKIHEMLDAPVTVSGTDPVITGKAGVRYICGTVDTLTLTPPASGIVDVVFTSGTTPTVLSVSGTVKWPGWFNPASLEASAIYEINIMDGVYGVVTAWA